MAYRWLDLWEQDSSKGMICMLQFFLDVAGYQNFQISKIYGTNQFKERLLLQEWKHDCPLLLQVNIKNFK